MPDETPAPSGRDLARQALLAYKVGRTPGQTPARKKTRRGRDDRTDGRDPVGLSTVLGRLTTEEGWDKAVDGGNILDQWPDLCPQFIGRVDALAFEADRGVLHLRPGSAAYATQLRLLGGQLCKQINDKLGREAVRAVKVLTVAALADPAPVDAPASKPGSETTPPPAPAQPRARDPRYLELRAVHDAHKPAPGAHLNPRVRDAIAASDQALADPAKREPEIAFADAVAERERLEAQAGPSAGSIEASIAAAIAAKHLGTREPRRLFEAS